MKEILKDWADNLIFTYSREIVLLESRIKDLEDIKRRLVENLQMSLPGFDDEKNC